VVHSLGTPCQSVFGKHPWEMVGERERVWCCPTEKFKHWRAWTVKGTVSSGTVLPGEEQVPSPEDHCRNTAPTPWLIECLPAAGVCCQAGLRTLRTSPENYIISPPPSHMVSNFCSVSKTIKKAPEGYLPLRGVCSQAGLRALSKDPAVSPASSIHRVVNFW
jgi:hypothetical protein